MGTLYVGNFNFICKGYVLGSFTKNASEGDLLGEDLITFLGPILRARCALTDIHCLC